MDRNAILTIKETERDNVNYEFNVDITEMDASQFIDEMVKVMRFMGYHEVSIWRALDGCTYGQREYLETIGNLKDEWESEGI